MAIIVYFRYVQGQNSVYDELGDARGLRRRPRACCWAQSGAEMMRSKYGLLRRPLHRDIMDIKQGQNHRGKARVRKASYIHQIDICAATQSENQFIYSRLTCPERKLDEKQRVIGYYAFDKFRAVEKANQIPDFSINIAI